MCREVGQPPYKILTSWASLQLNPGSFSFAIPAFLKREITYQLGIRHLVSKILFSRIRKFQDESSLYIFSLFCSLCLLHNLPIRIIHFFCRVCAPPSSSQYVGHKKQISCKWTKLLSRNSYAMEFHQVLDHTPISVNGRLPLPTCPDPQDKRCQDNHRAVSTRDREPQQDKGYLTGLNTALESQTSFTLLQSCHGRQSTGLRLSKAHFAEVLSVHNHEIYALNTWSVIKKKLSTADKK